jgi:predicted RNase H-like HicB family nuclease
MRTAVFAQNGTRTDSGWKPYAQTSDEVIGIPVPSNYLLSFPISPIPDSTILCGEIGSLYGGNWIICQSLTVQTIRDEDGMYVSFSDEFLVHGHGKTREEAIMDYVQSLVEYYLILESHPDNMEAQSIIERLKTYLQKNAI